MSNSLLPKLAAYREFAVRYSCDFPLDQDRPKLIYPFWKKSLELDDRNSLKFIGMNSVMVSDKSDALGLMVLGNQQYIIQREPYTELIIMMHHPPQWYRDYEKV